MTAFIAVKKNRNLNPAISIYNLVKSVDRCLKYQYINTFLFLPAAVRRYQKRNCGQSIQQAFSIGDACFIYIKKL